MIAFSGRKPHVTQIIFGIPKVIIGKEPYAKIVHRLAGVLANIDVNTYSRAEAPPVLQKATVQSQASDGTPLQLLQQATIE